MVLSVVRYVVFRWYSTVLRPLPAERRSPPTRQSYSFHFREYILTDATIATTKKYLSM